MKSIVQKHESITFVYTFHVQKRIRAKSNEYGWMSLKIFEEGGIYAGCMDQRKIKLITVSYDSHEIIRVIEIIENLKSNSSAVK